ncbi:ketopantoate reductase family protein [Streptomyces sp. NPDC057486]|uniref:ketopantoate reductase family protein n=1 Tax=Streptomyces sp. NPDC057486 TaxID=3346145 RepID=UPI0036D126F4
MLVEAHRFHSCRHVSPTSCPATPRRPTQETQSAVAATGFPVPTHELVLAGATVTERDSKPASSSLYRDLLGGRPTEVEQISGNLVARARALSVPTPRWTRRYCNCGCTSGG